MKKFLSSLLIAFSSSAVLLGSFEVQAQSLPKPIIAAKSWVLLDATSNQVIDSENANLQIEPASLTKIMTAYLVFNALKEKRLDLAQQVTVSTRAWKVDASSSKMFIDPATPVSINDLLFGLIVQSGNDASVALAEAVAGSEDAFVVQMNREAARLGMKSTRYANSHGLPSPDNFSTASDLALLASRLILDHPEFYKTYYSTKSFTYNKITQANRNRLLWLDPTVDGMKTGHTESAKYCLISSAIRPNGSGQRRLISVVTGTDSDQVRAQESLKLLNWGFLNFDTVKLYAKDQAVDTPEVWKGSQGKVKIGFTQDLYVTLPKGSAARLKPALERKDPLVAPIDKNSKIGTMKMMLDGKPVVEFPVVALEQVSQASIFGRAWDSIRLLFK
ncbi:D-alanyl-D-alanine carboxypeptidase [Undibacterium sp. LX40W]|uniref:serine-type D-Ala-D-Ala carboxypeptidase n=1 Tax=Undibacterium nitidum TaxID=2762298 RepID=A0A923HQM5_9BURK|nr:MULTISPECIES: D-alanyl-D-alanine carboxypeptidase family protein [Undibacterium]MBC3882778.1 D-alanyl-D-alanine carboxypeptidase [Undibacterium nitidum]MBC3893039.1 D-alanyl-D-alanine carboxypeptidase [Undibacterium sp. LX40W]